MALKELYCGLCTKLWCAIRGVSSNGAENWDKSFSLVNRWVPAPLSVAHPVGAPALAVRPRALPAD
jgi:hypothetical protein